MLPNRIDDISANDILHLVADKIAEHNVFEYKQALVIGTGDERAEFLADVSSFANASGGDIIFGIAEERDGDGKATGIPADVTPLELSNPATECARIEQLVESGVQPRIPVVQVKAIQIPERGHVIVVRVGKSWIAPHMVTYANRSRFYSRNSSTGKVQLDVQQIGAAFAAQRDLGERLRAWKVGRIAKAVAGDGPVALQGTAILLHIISASALTGEQWLPRIVDQRNWQLFQLMSLPGGPHRYNADGYLVASGRLNDGSASYLQIFRDGSLEYGDSNLTTPSQGTAIPSANVEVGIIRALTHGLQLVRAMDTPDPIFVTLSLIGAKGRQMALPNYGPQFGYLSPPFDRDVIVAPDVLLQNVEEGHPYPSTLLPVINSIWQAAGLPESPYIRSDGAWRHSN
jgi:hypothetical protein